MANEIQTAAELIAARYGVNGFIRESAAAYTVGTSDQIIANNSPNRIQLVLTNLHASALIYIRPLLPATLLTGMIVGPAGGQVKMSWVDDLTLPAYEWHAISDTAGANLYILELLIAPDRGRG